MIRLSFFAIFLLFCKPNSSFSQTTKPEVIEKLTMTLVYKLGFVNMPSAEIWFQESKSNFCNQPSIMLEAKGNTLKAYDLFYKYSSTLKANIDSKTSQLSYFERNVLQNGNAFKESYLFDNNKKAVYCKIQSEKAIDSFDTLQTKSNYFDFLSAFRYLRFINYKDMKTGQKIPITILLENKLYPLYIKYSGIENIRLPDGNRHNCYKINIQVIKGSVFKGDDALTAWVSCDDRRLPIQINADILVGSLNAYLVNVGYSNVSISSNK